MVDMTNDVTKFETMFGYRFTAGDEIFMKIKSKPSPNPIVIHPWKAQRKVWNKRWDYSSRRNQDDSSRGSERDHHRREGNSRSSHRDHPRDGDRLKDRDHSRDRDHLRDRERDRKYDYQSALKSYTER